MLWRYQLKNKLFSLCKPFARKYQSNNKENDWIKPKTAIGVSQFKLLLLNSTVFVDKSLLIRDFFNDSSETLIITFPRRWGKSINMDMIKKFFTIEVDENGILLPIEKRENLKLFSGGKFEMGFNEYKELQPLKISNCKEIMKFQGLYPVVDIDLANTKGSSYKEILSRIKEELLVCFLEHKYLSRSERLTNNEILLFNNFIDYLENQNLTVVQVSGGLRFLTYLLYKHFGTESIILMDEYDAAINHSLFNLKDKEKEKVLRLFRSLNETTFKNNKYLKKGLLTGVLRLAKSILFSSYNNSTEYSILDEEFFNYYGFTHLENDYLLNQYKVPNDLAKDIKDWYNGYTLLENQTYNPWSILKCLKKFDKINDKHDLQNVKNIILQNYWEESGNIDFIIDLLKVESIKSRLELLLNDQPFHLKLHKNITKRDMEILKEVINLGSNYKINNPVEDLLFSFLFYSGYLTTCKEKGFKLPNMEIKTFFQNKLLEFYYQQYRIDTNYFLAVTDQLKKILDSDSEIKLKESIESFKESFIKLLAQFPKFEKINSNNILNNSLDNSFNGNENLIQCCLSYTVIQLKSLSKFGTEVYLGKGVADLMFIDGLNKKGVIIEIKYNKDSTLAVEQAKSKEYANKINEKFNAIIIGLNVSENKEVDIEYNELIKL